VRRRSAGRAQRFSGLSARVDAAGLQRRIGRYEIVEVVGQGGTGEATPKSSTSASAKLLDPTGGGATKAVALTESGTLLGSLQLMSPRTCRRVRRPVSQLPPA
jgi:hypothetical protein